MNNRKEWRQVQCPVCQGRDLSFKETRDVSLHFRQRTGPVLIHEGRAVIYEDKNFCLYEYDRHTAYPRDIQGRCHGCGLKWELSGCRRIDDLRYTPKSPEAEKGTTRRIKASDVVSDILARMTDTELMSKYNITARQLEVLLQRMVEKGLVTQRQITDRLSLADTAITKAFDETRRSIEELDFGYNQFQSQPPVPTQARQEQSSKSTTTSIPTINVNSFITDMLGGVPDGDLMTNYSLNPKQLEHVFQRMVDSGYITVEELSDRAKVTDSPITKSFVKVYRSMQEFEG